MSDEEYLREKQVLEIVKFSRAKLHDWFRAGKFPKPKKDGNNNLWIKSEVMAWMENRPDWTPPASRPPKPAAEKKPATAKPAEIPPHRQDEATRCRAEMKRLGYAPDDDWAFSAIMNRILEQDQVADAWDEIEGRG